MAGVNKVILVGNLGKDPEMKTGQSGTAVCRFSLATAEKYKGEEKTEWHNLVYFGKTAEVAGKYLSKGKQVYIDGRIQTRTWRDGEGHNRSMTEVVVNNLQMLGGAGKSKAADRPVSEDDFPF